MILIPIVKELFDIIVSKDIGYRATLLTPRRKQQLSAVREYFKEIGNYRYFILDNTYPILAHFEDNENEGVVFTPNNLPEKVLQSLVKLLESENVDSSITLGDWTLVKKKDLDPKNDYFRNNYTSYQSYECDSRIEEGVYELVYPKYSFVKELNIKKIDLYGDPENMIAYENKFNAYPEREYNRSLCLDYISIITYWADKEYGAVKKKCD
jgi:hypothetical protein